MKQSIRHKGAKVRMCAACRVRSRKDEADYIRIVLPKDGTACIDRTGIASGRGAYVCRKEECVRKLSKSRCLSRLLKGPVPEELYEELCKEVSVDG